MNIAAETPFTMIHDTLTTLVKDQVFERALSGFETEPVPFYDTNIHFQDFQSHPPEGLCSLDVDIRENRSFRYPVFVSDHGAQSRSSRAVILLHGLNERLWWKYFPWAASLCSHLCAPVYLIPAVYHMNRAPAEWGSRKFMMPLSNERKKNHQEESTTVSFVNAQLSQRLEAHPERFLTGGLHTIYDIEQLVRSIRTGDDSFALPEAEIDFYSYSIGCTLTEALLMADELREEFERILKGSRALLFCGGSLLEYANPVSRSIVDGAAVRRLNGFFDDVASMSQIREEFGRRVAGIRGMEQYVRIFSSLVRACCERPLRENLFSRIAEKISLISLESDRVFPLEGVKKSWSESAAAVQGVSGAAESTHENPFPSGYSKDSDEQNDMTFRKVFASAADFFQLKLNFS